MIPDTHCHLSLCEDDPSTLVREVAFAIDVGMGLKGSRESAERATLIDNVYATAGLHPNELEEFRNDPVGAIQALREIAAQPRVVAIGETGLDFYRDHETPDTQMKAFTSQLDLAKQLDLPVVIHCRDAFDAILDVLSEHPDNRIIMHCFSADVGGAEICAASGYFCSFAGNVTYPKNDSLRQAAAAVPQDLILAETDSPFLSPVPHRGKSCRPGFVHETARVLATARGCEDDEMFEILIANAHRAFAIP